MEVSCEIAASKSYDLIGPARSRQLILGMCAELIDGPQSREAEGTSVDVCLPDYLIKSLSHPTTAGHQSRFFYSRRTCINVDGEIIVAGIREREVR
jgi:hypothetical protein